MEPRATDVTWHPGLVDHDTRESLIGQRGVVVWLTGLSGSGQSTVGRELERLLLREGRLAYMLDGDNLRHGLNADLGFAPADRAENIRRVGAVAQLFADAGVVCIAAFVSPYRADRLAARRLLPEGRFIEVHVATPLEVCEARDPKGLYKKARAGEISDFTGISAPYEVPERPELVLETADRSAVDAAAQVLALLRARGVVPTP